MCFWKRKPKRIKQRYKIESIRLDEKVDANRYWVTNYRIKPVGAAYRFILSNLNSVNNTIIENDRKLSVSIIKMQDDENMVIEFQGYKQDISDYINLLIEKDINLIKYYMITLD